MKMTIFRTALTHEQTLGHGFCYDDSGQTLFSFRTLEPPHSGNVKGVSCIPPGIYQVKTRISPRFGKHFILNDVPGRELILIHVGNFRYNTHGCILVGTDHKYLDGDKNLDVENSLFAMTTLLKICPQSFELTVL